MISAGEAEPTAGQNSCASLRSEEPLTSSSAGEVCEATEAYIFGGEEHGNGGDSPRLRCRGPSPQAETAATSVPVVAMPPPAAEYPFPVLPLQSGRMRIPSA